MYTKRLHLNCLPKTGHLNIEIFICGNRSMLKDNFIQVRMNRKIAYTDGLETVGNSSSMSGSHSCKHIQKIP